MATTSLFRKWRSQSFQDLVGQESVVRTLRNALNSGSPARAYLFCGPRGTGKTSTARIFAKALNCAKGPTAEPCNECSLCRRIAEGSCMDVLEIDAASHTQVDKIREFIVDKVHFAPAEARFKVYIIDEVHKLSTSSFNALLKTLEEPPPHVVFILATTHPHELLPTILSRCQRHDFHRLTPAEIRDRLVLVAREEGIQLDPVASELLARSAEGSLRDALVQLEQVATFAGESVGEEEVRTLLGLAGQAAMNGLIAALASSDARQALTLLQELVQSGRDLGRLAGELVDHLRRLLLVVVKAADESLLGTSEEEMASLKAQAAGLTGAQVMGWLKAAMDLQGEARDAQRARLLWEMMLVRLTVPGVEVDASALLRRVERLEAALARGAGPGGIPEVRPRPPAPATAPAPSRKASPPEVFSAPPGGREDRSPGPAQGGGAAPESSVPPAAASPPPSRKASPADLGWGPTPRSEEPRQAVRPAPARPLEEPGGAGRPTPVPSSAPPVQPEVEPAAVPGALRPDLAPAEAWQQILLAVRDKDRRLHAVLAEARLQRLDAEELAIVFPGKYGWHFGRFQEAQASLEALVRQILGRPVRFTATLGGEAGPTPESQDEHRAFVTRAGGLFNGRVVGTE